MIIKDLFKKPIDRSIQGVVTIGNEDEEQKWMELEEYVCTDEITKQFRIFFRKYRDSIVNPTEKMAAWITGFFGSGKSHFLKILGYILENEVVAGVKAVDYFKDKIHDEMLLADMQKCAAASNKVVLFNIDSKAKSDSKNKTQAIMDIMLRAFNESIGYCGDRPWVADLERMLDDEGLLEAFVEKFEELSHRDWKSNRSKAALNKKSIVDALVEVRNVPRDDAENYVNDQINNYTNSTEEFAKIVNTYCKKNKTRIIFLMDEVGQFIGDNTQLMLNLQTCVEDLGKYCRGQAWVVVTSQQELKAMIDSTKDKQQDFSKIQARFDTRILLSGAEAGEVIKKRILEKKDNAVTPLMSLYDGNANKISNLIMFEGTPSWSGYKGAEEFKDVYPFVPYQFELLQKVFTAIREHGMSEGKHLAHSERSLLSAFQDSAKKYADNNDGILVPFDSFYLTIEQFIDWDIKTVFTSAEKKPTLNDFDIRVLRVLFMILHVKEMPATLNRIATLMVESLDEDKMVLKNKIADSLVRLEKETLIQKNGETYDFLTNAEQDVNKQINQVDYNEGEVKRTIFDIVYDRVFELTKHSYKNRYSFPLNRSVDDETKGMISADNITVKVITQFSGLTDPTSFGAESARNNALVVDMTQGEYISELIRANRIAIFKRNNSASTTVAMTEIMAKKSAELSERLRRAEDIIRETLRSAPMYYNGGLISIKEKDGKDRLTEALNQVVEQEYYQLGLVSHFYSDQKDILNVFNDSQQSLFGNDITKEANYPAYLEIINKIKNDKSLLKRTTVKALLDTFSKKPFGWRELDILGMIASLLKSEAVSISRHEVAVDIKDYNFKNDFVKKNGLDVMVIRTQEKIDDAILYQVKKIMNEIYSVTLTMKEVDMKNDVLAFFNQKREFLSNLKIKYQGKSFAGSGCIPAIYDDISAIVKTSDTATIFNEIIARKDSLEENAEVLEQLEAFYKTGSSQQKVYNDAAEIVSWYDDNNTLFGGLESIAPVVAEMSSILSMPVPFGKMSELGNLVFKANSVKDQILEEKFQNAVRSINNDKAEIKKELDAVLNSDISDSKKARIQDKFDEIEHTYNSWNNSISKKTPNLEAYVLSSQTQVKEYKKFINKVFAEAESSAADDKPAKQVRRKTVKVIDCVPTAKKKIKSAADIDSVVEYIKQELTRALNNNDEIDLD